MSCPSCGSAVPTDARFCPSCGLPLTARPDERRIVTVLFADLVGFTTLSEHTDPERVKELVDVAFERLVADIEAFGGRVDKIVGDAILALFGAPLAHEDDPERAVRAALRMQETAGRLRAGSAGAQLRIGVNTGEVLVGALRAGGDYTAMGDVVNIASRLQTLARPGEILVGNGTYSATLLAVRYESRGALTVKGRAEAVEAWAAMEAIARPGQRPVRELAPLVGREAEVALLRDATDAAVRRRRAHLIALFGDAGVGKSRLTREIATMARENYGAEVFGGRCLPYGEANPWWPLADALRRWMSLDASAPTDETRTRLRDAVAETIERPADDPETARVADGLLHVLGRSAHLDADPARAREDALWSLQTLLEALAAKRPLLLLLIDVHWAEEPVLELIDRVLPRLRSLPFVLVTTARTDADVSWAPPAGRHDLIVLNIEPLSDEATDELVTHLLGPAVTPPLVELVRERSGGNPFFVEELVALVRESEHSADAAGAGLPVTLRGLVAARLDALAPADRAVLEDAAVVGTSGSIDTVIALAETRGERYASGRLATLVERDLLERHDNEYSFRSDLVREVAYNTLTKAERARRHAAVARSLEQRATDTGDTGDTDFLETRAHHWAVAAELAVELGPVASLPSDVRDRAIEALGRAAEQATRAEAWTTAAQSLERALALLPEDADARLRRWLRLGLVHVAAELREVGGAPADARELRAEAEAAGDDRAVVRSLTVLGDLEQRAGELVASAAAYEEAIAWATRIGDAQQRAAALRGRGMTFLLAGSLDEAESTIEEAFAAFTELGERRGQAWALQNLAWISFSRGRMDEAEERVRRSAETFAAAGDWGGLQITNGLLAWIRADQGHFDEAEALASEMAADAERAGNRWSLATAHSLLANLALWQGRAREAKELAISARGAFSALGEPWGRMQTYLPEARALACLGDLDAAYARLAEWEQSGQEFTRRTSRGLPTIVASSIAAQAGDAERALAEAERADQDAHQDQLLGATERDVARGIALLLHGRAHEAREFLARRHERSPGSAHRVPVDAALALALTAEDDISQAIALVALRVEDVGLAYLDRVHGGIALGAALARKREPVPAIAAVDAAVEVADETESVLDQAVARLCRAVILEVLEDDAAGAARAEATTQLAALGIDAAGWERAVRLAATGHVEGAVSAPPA